MFRFLFLSLPFLIGCLSCYAQGLSSRYKVGDVCNIKYKEFGLGEWHDYQSDAFFLSYHESFGNNDVLIFTSEKECESRLCDYRISIHSTSGYYMLNRLDTSFKASVRPVFYTVFNHYIVAYEDHQTTRGEAPEHKAPEEDMSGLHYVIEEGVIRPLHTMTKSRLRHLRHEILSEKGHQYHASEITEYFLHRHKWRHVNPEEIHKVFNEAELFLLKGITDLIYRH